MNNIKSLQKLYLKIKPQILKKTQEFRSVLKDKTQKKIFAELLFCLLTPQSKATVCWNCVENIIKKNLLLKSSYHQILENLVGVRFKYKKASFIINAQKLFVKNNQIKISKILDTQNVFQTRTWLIKNVKGLGLKEASHFLRNIGIGQNIAILDRHILRNLVYFKVIKQIPKCLNKKLYLEIETKMCNFAKKVKIPMEHLDMVFWYKANNNIFK